MLPHQEGHNAVSRRRRRSCTKIPAFEVCLPWPCSIPSDITLICNCYHQSTHESCPRPLWLLNCCNVFCSLKISDQVNLPLANTMLTAKPGLCGRCGRQTGTARSTQLLNRQQRAIRRHFTVVRSSAHSNGNGVPDTSAAPSSPASNPYNWTFDSSKPAKQDPRVQDIPMDAIRRPLGKTRANGEQDCSRTTVGSGLAAAGWLGEVTSAEQLLAAAHSYTCRRYSNLN